MPRHEMLEKQKSTILRGAPKYNGGSSLPFAWSTAVFAIWSIDGGIYLSRVQSCVAVAIWVSVMRWLLCSYLSRRHVAGELKSAFGKMLLTTTNNCVDGRFVMTHTRRVRFAGCDVSPGDLTCLDASKSRETRHVSCLSSTGLYVWNCNGSGKHR